MSWISILFGIAALVLFIRSAHLLRERSPSPGIHSFGWVTLIVTALALLLYWLIAQGMLVISPEFGVAMVQGGAFADVGLMGVLLAIGIVVGIGWHSQRRRVERPDRHKILIFTGIAFGFIAAISTRLLNADAAEPLQIYLYDLWTPPLMLWAVTCLVAVAVAEPMFTCWQSRALTIVFPSAVIALYARLRPEFAGPYTEDLWHVVGLVALPAAWGIAGWLAVPWPLRGQPGMRAAAKIAVPVVGAVLGVVAISLADPGWAIGPPAVVAPAWPLLIALTWPALLAGVRWRALWTEFVLSRQRVGWHEWSVLGCVALITAGLSEIFYVAGIAPALALTIFLLAWIAYSELLYPGTILNVCKRAATGDVLGEGSPVRSLLTKLRAVATSAVTKGGALVGELFSAPSLSVALLKVALVVLLLVALAEIPSAGRTVVLAMQTPPKTPAYEGVGQAVADHIANSLSVLNDDLLPDLIVLKELAQEGTKGARATSHGSASLDAALSKSSDIKVFDTSIPVGALVTPVQGPMRALLGTRVVSGSLQESNGVYILLAESSTGESWRVSRERQPRAVDPPSPSKAAESGSVRAAMAEAAVSNPVAAKGGDTKAGTKAAVEKEGATGTEGKLPAKASTDKPATKGATEKAGDGRIADAGPADAIPDLAEELAFYVRRGDPKLAVLGMTRSWRAFSEFRKGLRQWRAFEISGSFRELSGALRDYRRAISIDPTFALARYRLALALREDGQPGRALEQLRASLHASPNFMPAVAALATTLWDFDQYLLPDPASFPIVPPEPEVARVREAEARELWQRIIQSSAAEASPVDLASANYGLCREALNNRTARQKFEGIERARTDMSKSTGALAEKSGDLRGLLKPDNGKPAAGVPAVSDAVDLDAVDTIAGGAEQTLSETVVVLGAVRGLLAGAKLATAGTNAALDDAELFGKRASDALNELRNASLRSNSRRKPERLSREYIVDAAEALSNAQLAMTRLVLGDVGTRVSLAWAGYRDRATDQMRVAYFYCKRGQELYARIPGAQRSTPAVQRAEGLVLNLLATLLERAGAQLEPIQKKWDWHCRSEDFPDANSESADGLSAYERGPYAAAALNYYTRAAALQPEDPDIRCGGARVARAMQNEAPMQALKDSVEARVSLGGQWLDLGVRTRDAAYLRRAIDEFGVAIARNPFHVDSLSDFAYAAYLWRLFNVSGDSVESKIDPKTLSIAEQHVRQAVGLTVGANDSRKRFLVRSTLGEILLAQNRSHEAVEELENALAELTKAEVGAEHAFFDELRWDLRQAAICAAIADERTGFPAHAKRLADRANKMISSIKESDRQRESRRFGDISRVTSAFEAPAFCNEKAGIDAEGDPAPPAFVLSKGIKYGAVSQRMCARHWIRASMQGRDFSQDLVLEVRGGGSGVSVPFQPDGSTEPKAFTDNDRESHQYYFAQLMEHGEPRSGIYPLQTFDPTKGDCSRNLLTLEFEPNSASKQRKQE